MKKAVENIVRDLRNQSATSASAVADIIDEIFLKSGCDTTEKDELLITAITLEEMADNARTAATQMRKLLK